MPGVTQAVLLSWSVPPAASFALGLTALVYLRGWILLRRAGVPFVPPWRAASFLLGLLSLWIALASPLDTFSGFIITAHMLQHMLLMMVAPPLILLGAPLIPLVRGLPVFAAREFAGPFLNWRVAIRIGNALIHPLVALLLMGVVMFAWHTPRLYELALASSSWHEVEHACFFLMSLIFWWPVIQPWPSRARRPRWTVVPYLFIGDLQNTTLSAILIFSDRVIYPSYSTMPRLFGFSALHDQAAAGAIMWVLGGFAFVVPAIVIAVQCLQARPREQRVSLPRKLKSSSLDALFSLSHRLSFGGRWLRRRLSTRAVEAISFLLMFAVTGLGLAYLASNSSDDDDQVLRLHEQSGAFAVSVFAPAGDLAPGSSGFNVLVQDRDTQDALLDSTVSFRAQQTNSSNSTESVRATDDSENRLLQTASLNLPTAGDWTLAIEVTRGGQPAEFSLPLRVVKPEVGFSIPWSYLVLVAFTFLLFLTYVRRHWKDQTRRSIRALPTPTPESIQAKKLIY
jgi:cytochrome c oxidase assembly factor CtaG